MLRVTLALAFTLNPSGHARTSDRYTSYAELLQHEVEGVDFVIRTKNRDPIAVLVIHGGAIEFGTSEIGEALMADDWSGYFFEGIKLRNNRDLHLTATRFDEPQALNFVSHQKSCVSVHGFDENTHSLVCLGGANTTLIRRLERSVSGIGFLRAERCAQFAGRSLRNIVNRCGEPESPGLQLELSGKLRRELLQDPERMQAFVGWIRSAHKPLR